MTTATPEAAQASADGPEANGAPAGAEGRETASGPTITELLARVMQSVGAVAKTDHNRQQDYNFRGVDAVVNAVGPALRAHGVVMVPHAGLPQIDHYDTKNGTRMTHVILPVTFAFHGPAGDVVDCHVYGESSDAGDKVLSKAHSVAWRVAMLQVFAIPTDDPDPDEQSHERAAEAAVDWEALGWDDQADYDAAWEQATARAASLPDENDKTAVKAWLKDQGWDRPLTAPQVDAWLDVIDKAAGVTHAGTEDGHARLPAEETGDPTLLDGTEPFG